ncbi:MAG: hypothetical protein R2817_07885 [Flavobacteriales bacterium]
MKSINLLYTLHIAPSRPMPLTQIIPLRAYRHLLLPLLVLGISAQAMGQGCSDAGVCTAGPIGEVTVHTDSSTTAEPRHFARLTFSYAIGERSTTILQVVPEVSIGATERLSFQLKVPTISVSGDLGSNSGLGDPVLTSSYQFIKKDHERLDGLVGVKLNSGDATALRDGRPLPMPYQTSLGTTDLLLGISYKWKRFSGALAYQHVLVQDNRNGFFRSAWAGSADSTAAAGYFASLLLERANDAVVRAQYAVPVGKLILQPGLLAIMHLGEDTQLNTADLAQRVAITGSDGLTLNLTVDARYKLSDSWAIEAAFGSPLVVREVRPDGLTRAMVLNLGLRYSF